MAVEHTDPQGSTSALVGNPSRLTAREHPELLPVRVGDGQADRCADSAVGFASQNTESSSAIATAAASWTASYLRSILSGVDLSCRSTVVGTRRFRQAELAACGAGVAVGALEVGNRPARTPLAMTTTSAAS